MTVPALPPAAARARAARAGRAPRGAAPTPVHPTPVDAAPGDAAHVRAALAAAERSAVGLPDGALVDRAPVGEPPDAVACGGEYACPVDVTLSVIGGKWKLLIYHQLVLGVTRFGQFRRAIPRITQTMLTQQLRELERDGIVTRTIYAEIPPRVEYALTDFGRTLESVIRVMCDWGVQYQGRVLAQKRAARPPAAHDG